MMSGISIYLIILIIAGLAIAINLVVVYNRKKRRISRLAGLAFAFVIAGIFLGGQRLVGYTLLGVGIILAVIDILRKANTRMSS